MPSSAPSAYHDLLEGKLLAAVTTGTTTGVTVKVKQINGSTPTWKTVAHRLKVIQKTATNNKVEVWNVAAGTTQSGQTVTLGTITRALPLNDGTDFTGSGTAQSFSAGADVFMAWDAHDAAMSAKTDITNTFTTHQLISSTNELRFADTATAVWDDGTNLSFKDSANATKTLAQLAAGAGSDEKVKISATDTTQQYLDDALLVTTPITKAINSGGANETLTLALDTVPVTKGGTGVVSPTSGNLLLGAGSSAMTLLAPGSSSGYVVNSNGSTFVVSVPKFYTLGTVTTSSAAVGASDINENAMAPTYTGTATIPANFLTLGARIPIRLSGTVRQDSGTTKMRLKMGSTVMGYAIFDASGSSWTSNTRPWSINAVITVKAIGASGSLILDGVFLIEEPNAAAAVNAMPFVMTADGVATTPVAQTIDTTATIAITVSAQFSASDAQHSCLIHGGGIDIISP